MSKRLCKAKSARGTRPCKKAPILGGVVCDRHGGRAPQVKAKAQERIREALADLIDPERLLRACAAIAYFDPRLMYAEDGTILPVSKWPDEVAQAMSTYELVRKNVTAGDGVTDDVIKPRPHDKVKALEMLFKHKGMLTEKVELSGTVNIEGRLAAARARLKRG